MCKYTVEDKNLLIKNKNDVTNDLEEEITLLPVSKLPLSKKLVELYKKGVFHLIADTELKHSSLRFAISVWHLILKSINM